MSKKNLASRLALRVAQVLWTPRVTAQKFGAIRLGDRGNLVLSPSGPEILEKLYCPASLTPEGEDRRLQTP